MIKHIDPTTNAPRLSPRKMLAGDHVLPRKAVRAAIKKYKNTKDPVTGKKNKLTAQQEQEIQAILDGRGNLRPMLKKHNSAKRDRNAADYAKTKLGKTADSTYVANLGKSQRSQADRINEVLNGKAGGTDWFAKINFF